MITKEEKEALEILWAKEREVKGIKEDTLQGFIQFLYDEELLNQNKLDDIFGKKLKEFLDHDLKGIGL